MSKSRLLLCNCENTMPIAENQLKDQFGDRMAAPLCHHLCRSQLNIFQEALKGDGQLTVACTQEAPLFQQLADELNSETELDFFNIRETAGWSREGEEVVPKIAALMAKAEYRGTLGRLRELKSDGMCLIYGAGDEVFAAASLLSTHLPVTILLSEIDQVLPTSNGTVPVAKGHINRLSGAFGAFEILIDNYAPAKVSSRADFAFEATAATHKATASLVLDLSGGEPLLAGGQRRDGYYSVDPGQRSEMLEAILALVDLQGEFEKPIYVNYRPDICAHSANQITGCSNCLDHCPIGAVTEFGEKVKFDLDICGGCGACASLCPTGAVSYLSPLFEDMAGSLQAMVKAYYEAGGKIPRVLIYAEEEGSEMVEALARFGDGLPSDLLPYDVHQVTNINHQFLLFALTCGVTEVLIVASDKMRSEMAPLDQEISLATQILGGLFPDGEPRFKCLVSNDPDEITDFLWQETNVDPLLQTSLMVRGEKRQIMRLGLAALHQSSQFADDADFQINLANGAPYGALEINDKACTLCLSCVSACPANALGDHPDKPQLSFTENSCVQCGICVKTCPEKALSLVPRYNFSKSALAPQVINEEEPFLCTRCNKPFGVKSTVERVIDKLGSKHWMFETTEQIELIKMCDDCRVISIAEAEDAASQQAGISGRPRSRTTEDYLKDES